MPILRPESAADIPAIAQLTEAAFRAAAHTSHTEHFIVDALRRAGQLTVSLVALEDGRVVGHAAASPVQLSGGETGWYGLGPVSVLPQRQSCGIGAALVRTVLAQLRVRGARGCVVLGDPAYYGRFGFRVHAGLVLPGVPPEAFQALALEAAGGPPPQGTVRYHEAFDASS